MGGVSSFLPCSLILLSPPPPPELKKKFSDKSRRFEFEWVISGQGLKIGLALKSRFTRENLRFFKSFQTGQGCLSSRGGRGVTIKLTNTVKSCHSPWTKIFFITKTQKLMILFKKTSPPPKKKRAFFLGGGHKFHAFIILRWLGLFYPFFELILAIFTKLSQKVKLWNFVLII